jgi:CRISPR-associated RAMP protein (TIGR02581 family)
MQGVSLQNRYLFAGEIILKTALHIGGGDSEYSATHSAVVKLADKRSYIPGSSLKGVFRSTVERIAPNIATVKSCTLFDPNGSCLTVNKEIENEYQKLREAKSKEEVLVQFLEEHLCETCKLFGSNWLAAKVSFSDATVIEPWADVFEVRDGVGIDRDSQKAVDKAKFDFEAVPAGTGFEFILQGENLSERELGLLGIGLLEMTEGMVPLGGFTSRGLGQCYLALRQIKFVDFTDLEAVKDYLINRKMVEVTGYQDFLKTRITNLF